MPAKGWRKYPDKDKEKNNQPKIDINNIPNQSNGKYKDPLKTKNGHKLERPELALIPPKMRQKSVMGGKTMQERMLEKQKQAAAEGNPTASDHAEVSTDNLDELERRTLKSVWTAKDQNYPISLEEFQNNIVDYLSYIYSEAHRLEKENKRRVRYPSISGLCCWMGISWSLFETYVKRPEYEETLMHFKQICAQETLDNVKNGKMNTIGGIYSGKVEHHLIEPTAPATQNNTYIISGDDISKAIAEARKNKELSQNNSVNAEYKEIL